MSIMKRKTLVKDIAVEWDGGIVRGFKSVQEAERFIKHVCKKTAPDIEYSIYKYVIRTASKKDSL